MARLTPSVVRSSTSGGTSRGTAELSGAEASVGLGTLKEEVILIFGGVIELLKTALAASGDITETEEEELTCHSRDDSESLRDDSDSNVTKAVYC